MTSIAQQTRIDPLQAFMAAASAARIPMPLIATRFDVSIDGGLAIVTVERTFRNAEPDSIEATITFPLPVHATLFALSVRIGERVLDARAKRKIEARAEYEDAIDRGKTAVLHEEILRGVHMLSLGHVPPGTAVEVRSRFAITLTNLKNRATLRIPLTVGDIYGRSGLPDCDELIHGGRAQTGSLTVECRDGSVRLLGGELASGRATVALDAPVDLEVSGWTPRELLGRAADGRELAVRVEPTQSADAPLNLALLIDHSGSMGELCSIAAGLTKHQAVVRGLDVIDRSSGSFDIIDLWEFNETLHRVGSIHESKHSLIPRLSGPSGGTEIGRALSGVMTQSTAPDLLLITDGKSHALDVQALARSGRRFSVVLIGEDSLEANVGHLAALTGGEIFVAGGDELAVIFEQALRSLRAPHAAPTAVSGMPQTVSVRRAGMTISASWREPGLPVEPTVETRAVGALAAGLVLPSLATEAAAALAEAEGLVTHLTSLVLVDETGVAQEGLPASRKVPLPTPRTAALHCMSIDFDSAERMCAEESVGRALAADDSAGPPVPPAARSRGRLLKRFAPPPWGFKAAPTIVPDPVDVRSSGLLGLADVIDWGLAPKRLQAGDLSCLDPAAAAAIRAAAAKPEVAAFAKELGLDPLALVVALIARAAAGRKRSAARIARTLLGGAPRKEVDALARLLGLR